MDFDLGFYGSETFDVGGKSRGANWKGSVEWGRFSGLTGPFLSMALKSQWVDLSTGEKRWNEKNAYDKLQFWDIVKK